MSGGHFDYKQHCITDIAESIEHELEKQGKLKPKEDLWRMKDYYEKYPEDKYYVTYPSEICLRMKEAVNQLRIAAIYAQRVDWYLSGDDGDDSFIERLDEDLQNLIRKPIKNHEED